MCSLLKIIPVSFWTIWYTWDLQRLHKAKHTCFWNILICEKPIIRVVKRQDMLSLGHKLSSFPCSVSSPPPSLDSGKWLQLLRMGHNHNSMRISTSYPRWVKLTGITQSSSISHLVEIGPSRQGACTPFALQLPVPWSWDAGMGGGDLLVLNGCAWGGCAHLIFWLGDWNLPPAYREQWRIWLNGRKWGVSWLKPQAPV